MNPILVAIAAVLVVAQLALPKRFAFLPLVIAACHLSNREILPELTPTRLLVIVGLGRAIIGGFMAWPTRAKPDPLLVTFGIFMVLTGFGHTPDQWAPSPIANHIGLMMNILGVYFYGKTYLPDADAFRRFVAMLSLVLVPLGIIMAIQVRTGKNAYHAIGAASDESASRDGKIRAQGPLRGPITAGTLGATSLPIILTMWRRRRLQTLIGVGACIAIVLSCNSSGPLAAVGVCATGWALWRWRAYVRHLLWALVALGLLFWIVKGRGPWYIMARMDLVGGSTGYFRAELIDSSLRHLDEWWLCGTDYTRHWMPTGVSWSPNHTDMVNYYLHLGVIGGLPLTLCLIAILVSSFRTIKRGLLQMRAQGDAEEKAIWLIAIALAAHSVSFISISYFDQMAVFFYLLVAAIPGYVATCSTAPVLPARAQAAAMPASSRPPGPRFYH